MLPAYKRRANTAAGLWFGTLLLLIPIFIASPTSESTMLTAVKGVVFAVNVLAFWFAFWAYAKAKGYSGLLGLVLPIFSFIGLIVLHSLKDKHPDGSGGPSHGN